jgi:salicylate hydroxylase
MTPNVSILLQRWGVDEVIGENLVQFEELNMRRKNGKLVGHTKIATLEQTLRRPWWVVHRAHLHEGLVDVARKLGAQININSAVTKVNYRSGSNVTVETRHGIEHSFELLIGADGINSVTRKTLFPGVDPEPPTTNCAYRALVPYEQIRTDPIAKQLIEKPTMEVWMGEQAYIITYPISAGKVFNMVLSHHTPGKIRATQPEIPIEEFRNQYKDFDPRIQRIIGMVDKVVSGEVIHAFRMKLIRIPLVALAAHGHRSHADMGIAPEECSSYGRRCSFHGQSHGAGRCHINGGWRISRALHRECS